MTQNNYWLDLIEKEEKEREEKELMEVWIELVEGADKIYPDKDWPGKTYMGDTESYCQKLLFRNAAMILAEYNKRKRFQAVLDKKHLHVHTLEGK